MSKNGGENKTPIVFSLSENWCLPSPQNLTLETREFAVDCGRSIHMISKKDLNSAETDTLTKSCSPTTIKTVNGEVQTHAEARVYVKNNWIHSWQVLEDTPTIDCLTSSSNSSTSPTMTVSSDNETWAWEDSCVSSEHVTKKERRDPLTKQTKIENQIKTKTTSKNGETRSILLFWNGCNNSEKILWMTEFVDTRALTPVLPMKYL